MTSFSFSSANSQQVLVPAPLQLAGDQTIVVFDERAVQRAKYQAAMPHMTTGNTPDAALSPATGSAAVAFSLLECPPRAKLKPESPYA
jgi:hypothetical protein